VHACLPRLITLSFQSEDDFRALDSDADDDFEPHYVGETAERDALVLSALATVHSSTTRNGSTPPQSTPFRVRQVSTNQTEPVFFLFERARPYGEDNVGKYTSAELIGLLGPNNIHRLLQQSVLSSLLGFTIYFSPATCAWTG
jgi:hypothetical protein